MLFHARHRRTSCATNTHVHMKIETTNKSYSKLPLFSKKTGQVTVATESYITTKSDPNRNPNPNATTKQHIVTSIQLSIVTRSAYPEKFIRDDVAAPFFYNFLSSLSISSVKGQHVMEPSVTFTSRTEDIFYSFIFFKFFSWTPF